MILICRGEARFMNQPIPLGDLRNFHRSLLVVGTKAAVQRAIGGLGPNVKAEQVLVRRDEVIYRVTFE